MIPLHPPKPATTNRPSESSALDSVRSQIYAARHERTHSEKQPGSAFVPVSSCQKATWLCVVDCKQSEIHVQIRHEHFWRLENLVQWLQTCWEMAGLICYPLKKTFIYRIFRPSRFLKLKALNMSAFTVRNWWVDICIFAWSWFNCLSTRNRKTMAQVKAEC